MLAGSAPASSSYSPAGGKRKRPRRGNKQQSMQEQQQPFHVTPPTDLPSLTRQFVLAALQQSLQQPDADKENAVFLSSLEKSIKQARAKIDMKNTLNQLSHTTLTLPPDTTAAHIPIIAHSSLLNYWLDRFCCSVKEGFCKGVEDDSHGLKKHEQPQLEQDSPFYFHTSTFHVFQAADTNTNSPDKQTTAERQAIGAFAMTFASSAGFTEEEEEQLVVSLSLYQSKPSVLLSSSYKRFLLADQKPKRTQQLKLTKDLLQSLSLPPALFFALLSHQINKCHRVSDGAKTHVQWMKDMYAHLFEGAQKPRIAGEHSHKEDPDDNHYSSDDEDDDEDEDDDDEEDDNGSDLEGFVVADDAELIMDTDYDSDEEEVVQDKPQRKKLRKLQTDDNASMNDINTNTNTITETNSAHNTINATTEPSPANSTPNSTRRKQIIHDDDDEEKVDNGVVVGSEKDEEMSEIDDIVDVTPSHNSSNGNRSTPRTQNNHASTPTSSKTLSPAKLASTPKSSSTPIQSSVSSPNIHQNGSTTTATTTALTSPGKFPLDKKEKEDKQEKKQKHSPKSSEKSPSVSNAETPSPKHGKSKSNDDIAAALFSLSDDLLSAPPLAPSPLKPTHADSNHVQRNGTPTHSHTPQTASTDKQHRRKREEQTTPQHIPGSGDTSSIVTTRKSTPEPSVLPVQKNGHHKDKEKRKKDKQHKQLSAPSTTRGSPSSDTEAASVSVTSNGVSHKEKKHSVSHKEKKHKDKKKKKKSKEKDKIKPAANKQYTKLAA